MMVMQLLNPLRRWWWHVCLESLEAELLDVQDEINAAIHHQQLGTYRALCAFRTEIQAEANALRTKLGFPGIN